MWRWGQPVWWHLPVCLGGRPLQHHHKYSATTRHKYFCLLGGHTEQENHCAPNSALLLKSIPLYCWQTSCCMMYHPFCFVLYGFGIGVGVSVVAFCCRSPTIYSSISCSRRRRPPPASRPSSFRLRLQRCGMRERARQLEAKGRQVNTSLRRERHLRQVLKVVTLVCNWSKQSPHSLSKILLQHHLQLIVHSCQKKKSITWDCEDCAGLRKIFRSNVGCADLSQAWWCCLPLSDWHVPLCLPRRTTQAQSRATAKTRIVFQSILPKTLSSVYLVRQTTLLGFVLSIGGPARSHQVNHLRQEDLLVTLEPKLCQEKASMSHLSIAFYISVVANS